MKSHSVAPAWVLSHFPESGLACPVSRMLCCGHLDRKSEGQSEGEGAGEGCWLQLGGANIGNSVTMIQLVSPWDAVTPRQ